MDSTHSPPGFSRWPELRLLASSLDALDVGLEIWDEQDRLVLYNRKINELQADFHTPEHIGQTYEALLRLQVSRGLIAEAIGQEEAWLASRLASRTADREPLLQEFAADQWVHIHETRTPEGYMVTARVDVTGLVHRGKMLEASNHQLAWQSATDPLTGLANRRRFDEALQVEWLRAARSQNPLSLLMVDIDHFKRYNDHYGHLAGDDCLCRVATVLSQCVNRAGELVARYGGEEFLILLPGADLVQAADIAQRCLERLQHENLPHAASPTAAHVTLSLGVACLQPDANLNATVLLKAADAAMYRAKAGGRNRFEMALSIDWELPDAATARAPAAPLQASNRPPSAPELHGPS